MDVSNQSLLASLPPIPFIHCGHVTLSTAQLSVYLTALLLSVSGSHSLPELHVQAQFPILYDAYVPYALVRPAIHSFLNAFFPTDSSALLLLFIPRFIPLLPPGVHLLKVNSMQLFP